MARLWSSGCELQSVTSGVEWDTTTGSPTISTSIRRSGAAALRCNPTSAAAWISQTILAVDDATAHIIMRCYVYVASAPSAITTLMGWTDGAAMFGIRMQTDRTLLATFSTDTAGTASAPLNLNQWYRLELDYNDSTDVATAYIDGAAWMTATSTAADIGGGSIAKFGVCEAATADIYFDDLAVNDTTGSAQTSLPGAGSIVHLHPDSAGDNAGWASGAGGTNNWDRASDVTPDDATTYNKRIATGTLTDDHNVGSAAAAGVNPGDAVTLVQVGVRAGSTSTTTTARDIVLRAKTLPSGTVSSSSAFFIATNGWATHGSASPHNYKLTSYTDPQGGGPWSAQLLDGLQIGYSNNTSSTNEIRVSTIWALVEFVPGNFAGPYTGPTPGLLLTPTGLQPQPQLFPSDAAAAGTAFTQALAGSVTPAGSLALQTSKALAGSATSSGALAKLAAKALAGTASSAGALAKQASKPLAGSASSAGALTRQTNKALTGSATSAGALAKVASKALAGAVTSAGSLATTVVRLLSVAGSISPAGALAKQAGKALTGQVTPAAGVSNAVGKAVAGSVASAGALAKQANKALTGAASSTGALTRAMAKPLAGAASPGGQLVRQAGKAVTGSITPTGSVTRQTGKALAAAATSAGAVTRLVGKGLAGTVVSAGSLAQLVTKALAGTVSAAGALSVGGSSAPINATSTPAVSARRTSTAPVTAARSSTPAVGTGRTSTSSVSDG